MCIYIYTCIYIHTPKGKDGGRLRSISDVGFEPDLSGNGFW
jgi:hypothetical protein